MEQIERPSQEKYGEYGGKGGLRKNMAAIYRFTFHFQNTEMTKMLSFIS
jgi:hypothetical protein